MPASSTYIILDRVTDHDALSRRDAPCLTDVHQRFRAGLVGKRTLAADGRLKLLQLQRGEVVVVEVADAPLHVAGDEAAWHTL